MPPPATLPRCGAQRPLKDQRSRRLVSLFHMVTVRAPRFTPCRCAVTCRGFFSPVAEIMPDRCTPNTNSTLVQRALTPAPWLLFAGSAYLDANSTPQTPEDLRNCPSLFMRRTGVAPVWRLRRSSDVRDEVVIPLTPRLLCDDMIALKQAAIAGLGIVALPGCVCRDDVRSGLLRRVLPPSLVCRRFHDHSPHSFPARSPPLGSRFRGSLGGRIAKSGLDLGHL